MSRAPRAGALVLVVGLLIFTRVIGISALLPVFAPYGLTLTENAILVGLAFGGYGLTMALMQVPMGSLSDRIGRRPVILMGLVLYVGGNLMAAWAPSIELLIAARLIEGLGAVTSVALALLADTLPSDRRTVGLAVAGIGAGMGFLLGTALGPFVAAAIGVQGLFVASAGLGVAVFVAVLAIVPNTRPAPDVARVPVRKTLTDQRGVSMAAAGFVMNATLTATLFALPLLLVGVQDDPTRDGPLDEAGFRTLLLVTVLVGGVLSIGAARAADRRGAVRATAVASALLIGAGAAGLLTLEATWMLAAVAVIYFGGHGAQSAALPSLVGQLFPGHERGAAMGGYNAATFLGSFVGGVLGGALYDRGFWLPVVIGTFAVVSALLLRRARAPHLAEPGRAVPVA